MFATCWAVLSKSPTADSYDFVAREWHQPDTADVILRHVAEDILKSPHVLDYLKCHALESWRYRVFELPVLPISDSATDYQRRKAYEACITTAYLATCTQLSTQRSAGSVSKPYNLALIIYPDHDMPKPLGPEHGKTDPKIIAAAQQKSNSLSAAAAPSQLHITQTPAHPDAIYDGRPWSLLGVPLTIYCKAFTEFRVTMANDSLEFDLAELTCARKLVSAAVQHVPTKYERIEALAALKQAVHADILTMEVMRLPNEIMPGGRICASSHFDFVFPILCLTEVKMEIGANSCDPMDQAKQDYRAIYRSEKYKPVRDASCCPCLLVAIAGPNIMVGGAVYVEQIIAASFTHYICIAPHDVDGPRSSYDAAIWRTAQLIHALKQATVALEDYYTAVTKTMDAVPAAEKLYVRPHLTQVSAADGTEISLVYTGRLCIDEPAKAIYSAHAHVAGASATADVVVKFTKAYSAEGHRLLAAHAFAPKLWFCEWVESVDMYVVVMEHIRDAETADEDVAMSAADAAAVRTAVELLHAEGLVFGDLRGPNVLLRKDGGPLLIDFDWCGPEGTACYPLGVNMHSAIPWHPDVNTGTLIKKEHDWHLLKMLTGS